MRITFATMVNDAVANNRAATDRLSVLQQQAAAGQQLLQPSDDPVAMAALLDNQGQGQRLTMYQSNIAAAQETLNASTSALTNVSNLLTQAHQIAEEASQSDFTPGTLQGYAAQLDGITSQLLGLANTQDQNHYIFSGTATQTQPFVQSSATGAVQYAGSDDNAEVLVSQGQTVTTAVAGSSVFQMQQRGQTIYSGNTGAAAGTGTDSATGQGTLLVSHTSTIYAGGSGVQTGTSSATGDTIIGPAGAHQLTINDTSGNGSAGTISLDGGPAVSFTNTDNNLKVTGPTGNVAYVDTTALTPGFNGTVSLTANGSLSVDGGASSVPIDFSGSQTVTDSTNGAVTNVDSSNIRRTGPTQLNYSGTSDVFQTLATLRNAILNIQGLPQSQQLASIADQMNELDRLSGNVLQVTATQGAALQQLDAVGSRIQSTQLQLQQRNGQLEGNDISTIIINMQAQQNTLQLTQYVTQHLFDESLLNFLR